MRRALRSLPTQSRDKTPLDPLGKSSESKGSMLPVLPEKLLDIHVGSGLVGGAPGPRQRGQNEMGFHDPQAKTIHGSMTIYCS